LAVTTKQSDKSRPEPYKIKSSRGLVTVGNSNRALGGAQVGVGGVAFYTEG